MDGRCSSLATRWAFVLCLLLSLCWGVPDAAVRAQGVADGEVVTVVGEGMPHFGRPHLKGDLRVIFRVRLPTAIDGHAASDARLLAGAAPAHTEPAEQWAGCPVRPLLAVCRNTLYPRGDRAPHSPSPAEHVDAHAEAVPEPQDTAAV